MSRSSKKAKKARKKSANISSDGVAVIRNWWASKQPVFRFVLLFFGVMIAFYALWATPIYTNLILNPWIRLNAWLAAGVLNVLGFAAQAEATLLTGNGFSLDIRQGCDAIEPTMLFVAGILATPIHWSKKWRGLLLGVGFMLSLNFIRILSLALVDRYWPSAFEFIHVEFWQAFFILLAITLWATWLKRTLITKPTHEGNPATA
ncbi:MAG: archaeosortase/exosortase family protein [Bacteroidota bacterium]